MPITGPERPTIKRFSLNATSGVFVYVNKTLLPGTNLEILLISIDSAIFYLYESVN